MARYLCEQTQLDLDGSGVGAQPDLQHLERRFLRRPDQVGQLVMACCGLRSDVRWALAGGLGAASALSLIVPSPLSI